MTAALREATHVVAVARRELLSLFVSPIAYVILFIFLLVNGATFRFYLRLFGGEMEPVLIGQFAGMPFWFLVLLVPPLLTMRTFAEERRTGTFELLVTSGVGDAALVCGKFLAAWVFFLVLWTAVLPLVLLVEVHGQLDWGIVQSLYFGIFLAGGLFTAIGVLASSMTQNQLVAAVAATIANLAIFFVNFLRLLVTPGAIELRVFEYISPYYHFGSDFSRGVIDLRLLVLYGSLCAWILFIAVKVLERRRWS